jgi:hypothetical protein
MPGLCKAAVVGSTLARWRPRLRRRGRVRRQSAAIDWWIRFLVYPAISVELATIRIARGRRSGLYRSRTSRVRLTYRLGKDQDQARSSVVWFRLLYLIVRCGFRWLAVVVCSKSGPPRKPNSRTHPPPNQLADAKDDQEGCRTASPASVRRSTVTASATT